MSPMLFILAMEALNRLVQKAADEGLLQPLRNNEIKHRASLYADDVILFLNPQPTELLTIREILILFAGASRLQTNLDKCTFTPIRCSEEDIALATSILPCQVVHFPCKYLGLPLSVKRISKASIQPIIDKVARRIPAWKGNLLHPSGRSELIKSVLTAIPIYMSMALALPAWAIDCVDRLCRSFLWTGTDSSHGSRCRVAWAKVCRPKDLGGLGILNMKFLGYALRARWLWQQLNEDPCWRALAVPAEQPVQRLIRDSTYVMLGDGATARFWTDKWVNGTAICDAFPSLANAVEARAQRSRTVAEGLPNRTWMLDITGPLSTHVIWEYLQLRDLLDEDEFTLQPNVQDRWIWSKNGSGVYTTKSAYLRFFEQERKLPCADILWKTWAPGKVRHHVWLALHGRLWTADRMTRRNMDTHVLCPLCGLEEETHQHLLWSCPFIRQLWRVTTQKLALPEQPHATTWQTGWRRWRRGIPAQQRRGFDSLFVLVIWLTWKERNTRIFQATLSTVGALFSRCKEEALLWTLAGAKKLGHLWGITDSALANGGQAMMVASSMQNVNQN